MRQSKSSKNKENSGNFRREEKTDRASVLDTARRADWRRHERKHLKTIWDLCFN